MPAPHRPPSGRAKSFLSVEVGNWFKATATGAGVFVVPLILLLLVGAAALARVMT